MEDGPRSNVLVTRKVIYEIRSLKLFNGSLSESLQRIGVLYQYSFIIGLIGAANTVLMLSFVGVSDRTDIWFASLSIVTIVSRILLIGFLSELFTPSLVKFSKVSHIKFSYIVSVLLSSVSMLCVLFFTVIFLSASSLSSMVFDGFSAREQEELSSMTRLIAPVGCLMVFNEVLSIVLNSMGRYNITEQGRILAGCLSFIAILIAYKKLELYGLFLASLLSNLALFSIQIRSLLISNLRLLFSIRIKFIKRLVPRGSIRISIFYASATQLYLLTFRGLLASFPDGFLTVFHYSEGIIVKLRSILFRPIAVSALREFTITPGLMDLPTVARMAYRQLALVACGFGIAAGIIYLFGEGLIDVVVENGSNAQVIAMRNLFAIFILLLPIDFLYIVLRKRAVVLGHYRSFYICAGGLQVLGFALAALALYGGTLSFKIVYLILFLDVFLKFIVVLHLNTARETLTN